MAGVGAALDRGALYAFDRADDKLTAAVEPSPDASLEEEIGQPVRRWLPVRVLHPRAFGVSTVIVIPLWVPTVPAALLAWWGWRRRRPTRRGFDVTRYDRPPR